MLGQSEVRSSPLGFWEPPPRGGSASDLVTLRRASCAPSNGFVHARCRILSTHVISRKVGCSLTRVLEKQSRHQSALPARHSSRGPVQSLGRAWTWFVSQQEVWFIRAKSQWDMDTNLGQETTNCWESPASGIVCTSQPMLSTIVR